MSTIINARSPYYVKLSEPDLYLAEVNMFIYAGVFTTGKPATPQYVLNQYSPTGSEYVVLEISEIIRDYLNTKYYEEAIDGVWVEVDYTLKDELGGTLTTGSLDYLAFDGFGYFNEGVNPRTSTDPTVTSYTPMVLQDNNTVYFVKGKDIRIPFFSEPSPTASSDIDAGVWNEADYYWELSNFNWELVSVPQVINDNDNSLDKIQYLVIQSDFVQTGNTVTFTSNSGNPQETVINFVEYCEPRYEPYRIIFYNKYGALQDIWCTKKSTINISTKDESYKANVMDFTGSPDYSLYDHNKRRFNVEANQSITLNTDYLKEEYNDVVEQMLMSEQVWIENDTEVIPVVLKSKSLQLKTSVNDKLIQYTFEFDYAFDTIQNIR
jgi:hypothetical protein